MIELYTDSTFNGQRASIMLEETGLDYTAHRVNLTQGEQRKPSFLKLNPRGQIPVLVDHADTDTPFIMTQSITILIYLSEKTGMFTPTKLQDKMRMYEWLQFHAVDIGANVFSAYYLSQLCPTPQPQAAEILTGRVIALYRHFNKYLSKNEYLGGTDYSIADIAAFPAVLALVDKLAGYPHLNRWVQQVNARPAVIKGLAVPDQ